MAYLINLMRRYERGRRFWRHVDVRARDECWQWHGRDAAGAAVHAYELMRGPLPPQTRLQHRCGNALCVNPDHMDVVHAGAARQ